MNKSLLRVYKKAKYTVMKCILKTDLLNKMRVAYNRNKLRRRKHPRISKERAQKSSNNNLKVGLVKINNLTE